MEHLPSSIVFDELDMSPNGRRFRVSDECDLPAFNQFLKAILSALRSAETIILIIETRFLESRIITRNLCINPKTG